MIVQYPSSHTSSSLYLRNTRQIRIGYTLSIITEIQNNPTFLLRWLLGVLAFVWNFCSYVTGATVYAPSVKIQMVPNVSIRGYLMFPRALFLIVQFDQNSKLKRATLG